MFHTSTPRCFTAVTMNSTEQLGVGLDIRLGVEPSSHTLRQGPQEPRQMQSRASSFLLTTIRLRDSLSSPVPPYDLLLLRISQSTGMWMSFSVFIFLYGEEIRALPFGLGISLSSLGQVLVWIARLLYSKGTHGTMFKQFILKRAATRTLKSSRYCVPVIYQHWAKHIPHVSGKLCNDSRL